MEERSFDRLARALGGASTRRGAIAALGALLAGGAALDADAKRTRGGKERAAGGPAAGKRRNKKRCNPECTGNFSCVKGACTCESVICGTACCDAGQVCQRGRCVGQGTVFCHDLGETCGDGTRCCDGLQCGSGYGGGPVACWPVPGGECVANEECAYGQHCEDGACVYDPPPPPPPPPVPACSPTFIPTADAAANGKALQDAVVAASSGDTIFLAPADYQFNTAMTNFFFGALLVRNKEVVIERCGAAAVVNLICPSGLAVEDTIYCVHVVGTPNAPAKLTLDGVVVKDLRTSTNRFSTRAERGMLTLRDVTVEGADSLKIGVQSGTVTIDSGVVLRGSGIALRTYNADASMTCTAVPEFDGVTQRCNTGFGGTIVGCGCP